MPSPLAHGLIHRALSIESYSKVLLLFLCMSTQFLTTVLSSNKFPATPSLLSCTFAFKKKEKYCLIE